MSATAKNTEAKDERIARLRSWLEQAKKKGDSVTIRFCNLRLQSLEA